MYGLALLKSSGPSGLDSFGRLGPNLQEVLAKVDAEDAEAEDAAAADFASVSARTASSNGRSSALVHEAGSG